jgi:hypothetical protein
MQILCTHVSNWKNAICGNYSRNEGRGMKNGGGGMTYLIYFKNFCKCHNVPHPAQQQQKSMVYMYIRKAPVGKPRHSHSGLSVRIS